MRMPALNDGDALEVKMTPMIDVVFLLLIFFVWTSSFELPEFDLPSSIAEPPAGGSAMGVDTTPPVEAFEEIIIRVRRKDASVLMELNGEQLADLSSLKQKLAEIIELGVQPPVIVDPEDSITMNTAVGVYDAARDAGVDRVLFPVFFFCFSFLPQPSFPKGASVLGHW